MQEIRRLTQFELPLTVNGVRVDISGMERDGSGDPLVFLHGFGSSKEDYSDVVQQAALTDRPVLAYDAPGFGRSKCADPGALSIPFLVSTALAVLADREVGEFNAVGHSMGGLTALMLGSEHPGRLVSFVDIEGNLAPEDCFLSRQIIDSNPDPDKFLADFVDRAWNSRYYSSSLYSAGIEHKVRSTSVRGIFESMVDLSDNGDLMTRFLRLDAPKMFMFGEQNATLSYLGHLARHGVELAEIPFSGHFPMYSNPPEMWRRITEFLVPPSQPGSTP